MRRTIFGPIALALALAACAGLPDTTGETADDVDALFAEMRTVASLPAERQRAVFDEANAAAAQRPDLLAAVRLALLLSLPGTTFQDDEAAALLLDPYVVTPPRTSLQRYAALLREQLRDKARLARRTARLRDELAATRMVLGAEEAHDRQVATLVNDVHGVSRLPPEEQREEVLAAQVSYAERPSDYGRIRLALLLSLPGTPLHDERRALALLEPFKEAGEKGPLQQFGALLHRQLAERMRDRRQALQLKEQLEALRAIERSLIERKEGR